MIGRMFHSMFLAFLILLQTSSILSIVLELNQTTFDEHVFTNPLSDHWFITFYAPWCEHCKKLYPVLDELSSYLEMKNTNEKGYPKVTVAKINAPKNREIADRYGIDKFPRILYKKDNITGIYDGPRSLQGFQLFLDRFNDPIYQIIEGREEGEFKIPSIHPYHNVTFILQLYCSLDETNTQSATNVPPCSSKTKTLYSAFERVATQLHLHTTLAVVHHSDVTAVPTSTKDSKSKKTPIKPEATFCKFSSRHIPFGKDMFDSGEHQIISHDDELYCVPDLLPTNTPTTATTPSTTGITEDDLTEKLATFIQRNNYPFMNIFENHNFKILSHLNKTMIIGIIDERKDISAKAILTQLKATYLQIIDSHPDRHDTFYEQYIVGYLDGKKWKQFVRHHDAFVPSILIIDHQDERHAVMKLPPSAKATEKYGPLIKKVLISLMVDETIEMSETIPPGIVRKMMHRFKKYFPYSILVIALPSLFLIMALKFFPFPQRRKAKKQ